MSQIRVNTIQNANGTTALSIASNGNVGIGTSSPTGKLDVSSSSAGVTAGDLVVDTANKTVYVGRQSSTGGDNSYLIVRGRLSGNTANQAVVITGDTTAYGTGLFRPNDDTLGFSTFSTERMRISGGDFFVGTTTGTINTTNKGFAISGGDGEVRLSRLVGGSSPVFNVYGSQGEARIMGDGDLENTNNRYTGISDIKFKQNIVDAKSQWADIKAIQVRNYELVAYPDRKQIGCVAQELEQVCPHLVIEREDTDGETYKSVAYSVLYMKAFKALQEAMGRIETLETKADTQSATIDSLTETITALTARMVAVESK